MKIKYHKHNVRREKAKKLWLQITEEYNRGDDPNEIIKRYINPRTGKHYTRAHLYWVLKKVQNIKN